MAFDFLTIFIVIQTFLVFEFISLNLMRKILTHSSNLDTMKNKFYSE